MFSGGDVGGGGGGGAVGPDGGVHVGHGSYPCVCVCLGGGGAPPDGGVHVGHLRPHQPLKVRLPTHTHTHTHARTRARTHARTHTRTHTHTHTHTHCTQTSPSKPDSEARAPRGPTLNALTLYHTYFIQ